MTGYNRQPHSDSTGFGLRMMTYSYQPLGGWTGFGLRLMLEALAHPLACSGRGAWNCTGVPPGFGLLDVGVEWEAPNST